MVGEGGRRFCRLAQCIVGLLTANLPLDREGGRGARQLASEYGHLYGDLLELKGEFLEEQVDRKPSSEKLRKHRVQLEALKKRRQDINAIW
jgi:hypothetical protein